MDTLEYDRRYLWHPYASLKDPPPVRLVDHAEGTQIYVRGRGRSPSAPLIPLTDGVASWWCMAHGYGHPHIVDAIRRQAEKLPHVMFGGFTHEPAVTLAERLATICPKGLNKVFFADSGSIAVEVAVKMCIQYQHAKGRFKRTKMLSLKGGYHGDTACAMALSDPDGMHTLFAGMMPKHLFASQPSATTNDELRITNWDFEQILREHQNEICGVICEPIFQAANAMNFYSGEYLRTMRKLCDEFDIPLVFDEIAAGFYRTGPRWAHEVSGISPDIMTIGKALTGGHITLAATIASENVAEVISNGTPSAFMHGPTYMANPIACAAANASLDLFEHPYDINHIEGVLKNELPSATVHGAVAVIKVPRLPARADIERVINSHHVWLRPFANFIYTMPPLIASDDDLRRIAAAMKDLASSPPGPEEVGDFHE